MEITKVSLVEVGDMEETYRRPYQWSADGDLINDIVDTVERGNGRLAPSLFVDVAGRALTVSNEVEEAILPGMEGRNAWRKSRFRFIIEVLLEGESRHNSVTQRAIVSGYTDRAEISMSNHIDPDTRFHINSVVTLQDIRERGGRKRTMVIDSSQTILGRYGDHEDDTDFLIRPSDLFSTIEVKNDPLSDGNETVDTNTTCHLGTQLTKRGENTSSRYLSTLINTDVEAKAQLNSEHMLNHDETRDVIATDMLSDNILRNNKFLKALSSYHRKFHKENFITYDDIAHFSHRGMASLDENTDVVLMRNNNISYESEHWSGATADTVAAYQICHAIPVIMIDCLFSSIRFTISNVNSRLDDGPEFHLDEATSFAGKDFYDRSVIRAFQSRIIREVFKPISNNGHMLVDLEVESDVGGVTRVFITIGDSGEIPYVFPTFADAMLSPVVTNDKNVGSELADTFIDIRKEVDLAVDRFNGVDTTTSFQSALDTRSRNNRERSLSGLLDSSGGGLDLL